MIHIYKDELDESDIKLIANEFIKVKEARIVTLALLILRTWTPLPPFYLHLCFWVTTFFPIRYVHEASLPTFSS